MVIRAPKKKLFEFIVEPKNTHLWFASIEKESVDTDQINLGTKYTNNKGLFEVTDYEKDVFIEHTETKTGYQRSYSFRGIDDANTEVVYFEATFDDSELSDPFKVKYFEKLKELLEK